MNSWDVRGNITVAEAVAHSILMFMLYGPDGDEPYTLPSYYTSYYTDASNDSDYSTENDTSQEQEFADLYNSLGNIGYDKLIDSYGSNWSGDHGYIDDDGVGVFPGFAGDYSSDGDYNPMEAYQTEQMIAAMNSDISSNQSDNAGWLRQFRTTASNRIWPNHYERNIENRKGLEKLGLWDIKGITSEELKNLGFKPVSQNENVFHNWGPGNEKNQKWVLSEEGKTYGRLEIIIDGNGNQVTDPKVMGTYNYKGNKAGHVLNDVVPYYLFGNSPEDPTTIKERILRTFEAL